MSEQDRQLLTTEVIEMGEQLFAFALEGRGDGDASEDDLGFPRAEIEAASAEFFSALRLLMSVNQPLL